MSFQYLIAVGSNIEPRLETILKSIHKLSKIGAIETISRFYYSAPIGPANLEFINGALILSTKVKPESLLKKLIEIEVEMGRIRDEKWGNRPIDLDILLVRNELEPVIVDTEHLTVPHPEMTKRDFVLVPACEIAADWELLGKSICEYKTLCMMNSILSPASNSET